MIFIEQVLLNGERTNLLIDGNKIAGIGTQLSMPATAIRIDGKRLAAFPTLCNCHTHAAMSLFRGYANDLPLMTWLNDWIWPREKHLDDDIIYWGTKLACLEMVKSGTTALNDMYFFLPAAARAIRESGLRALLGFTMFGNCDEMDNGTYSKVQEQIGDSDGRIVMNPAPHAIYTVSAEGLQKSAQYCKAHMLPMHIHMSETQQEVDDCVKQHGCRPYEYLDQLGILEMLGPLFIGAHSLYLSDKEIELIGKHGCQVVHNPNSNLKLGSGHQFRYSELKAAGVNVALGTDGCSSSDNLDMIEATKVMALLQKGWRHDPTTLPAKEALRVASRNGFQALGIQAGEIAEGMLADIMLVDLDNLAFVPCHDATSSLVYSAHGDAVDTVICDGQILMQHHHVEGEEEIIAGARKATERLFMK